MFDYLRYYFSPALQVMAAVGIYIGGPYCWLGLATLPGLAIIDDASWSSYNRYRVTP